MKLPRRVLSRIAWVTAFGVGFGFVESSVVVYLRGLYYPGGFSFPLRLMSTGHVLMEALREIATLVVLVSVAALAAKRTWERVGYFLLGFGVWDIFYYVWLALLIGWPASLIDWDVLFLIPIPWIGPVIAPLLLSLQMAILGAMIPLRLEWGLRFGPGVREWGLGIAATALILTSFLSDTGASLHGALPEPYSYLCLSLGILLYGGAFLLACRRELTRKA
jgi:hypothetical protein